MSFQWKEKSQEILPVTTISWISLIGPQAPFSILGWLTTWMSREPDGSFFLAKN